MRVVREMVQEKALMLWRFRRTIAPSGEGLASLTTIPSAWIAMLPYNAGWADGARAVRLAVEWNESVG